MRKQVAVCTRLLLSALGEACDAHRKTQLMGNYKCTPIRNYWISSLHCVIEDLVVYPAPRGREDNTVPFDLRSGVTTSQARLLASGACQTIYPRLPTHTPVVMNAGTSPIR